MLKLSGKIMSFEFHKNIKIIKFLKIIITLIRCYLLSTDDNLLSKHAVMEMDKIDEMENISNIVMREKT